MSAAACAVGRHHESRDWIGFAPSMGGGYDLVVGRADSVLASSPAEHDDVIALAVAYFEEALGAPPEHLAATHADIGVLIRHAVGAGAGREHSALQEAVDAIDDGLAADVVVSRLVACMRGSEEPVARLERRATELGARRDR